MRILKPKAMKHLFWITTLAAVLIGFSACQEQSDVTGWNYNDPEWGGFEKPDYREQETGPNLVHIPGGTFTMGQAEQDLTHEVDNVPRKVTVSSFYIDETEVTNIAYREYLHWINDVFMDFPEVYDQALPDTNSWRERLGYNEPMVEYYFRHPAYNDYPVVGVSWEQAQRFAEWRTDRVNERILVREGILERDPDQTGMENFNTDAYLEGLYEGIVREPMRSPDGEERRVRMEDGILLPDYRLPTEAEWEYAAIANIGSSVDENVATRRNYPWEGLSLRKGEETRGRYRGKFRANFQRGRGDYAGIANEGNPDAVQTAPVRAYWQNDFGLYNMGSNVSEWVKDVYRPLSFEMVDDLNPHRGNVFQVPDRDEDGWAQRDSLGRVEHRDVTREENEDRRNYREADQRGHEDPMEYEGGDQQYQHRESTLISNEARVYKGASWDDRGYFISPRVRRFLDQSQSTATIGFRLAMDRVGPSHKKE